MTQSSPKILLLNREPERLAAIESLLKNHFDYSITSTTKLEKAIEKLKTESFDFIISNIKFQQFDAWRLARLVRSGVLHCEADTPFIIVANTWCEHIAQTTAREFAIDRLISFEQRHQLIEIIQNINHEGRKINHKPSLLVVEDNPDTLNLVERILSPKFNIDKAEDGEVGLERWRQGHYALVLLDVMLPKMTGTQVIEQILKQEPSQSVVIMTANHSMELAEKLMLKGAADFVTKPFRAEQLRQVCETAARREDFMISNDQFAAKVESLNASRAEYKRISDAHQTLLDQLGSVVIELNLNGEISFLNKAWENLTGFSIEESQQRLLADFVEHQSTQAGHLSGELRSLLTGASGTYCFEFKLKNTFHEEIWVESRFNVSISKGTLHERRISGTIDNITAKKKAQQDLEYLAMHDGLTGLFNRHYFETELKQFAATASRGHGPHALLYIDLDNFKVVNDTLGHPQGDILLKEMATVISSRLRDSDIFSRIGGDEFSVLLANTSDKTALQIATDLCRLLDDTPCQIGEQVFKVNCSIGVAQIDGRSSNPEEYMKQADIALYAAKKQGRNLAHLYNIHDEHSKALQTSLEWSRKLRQALVDDNLTLYFQPIIDINSRQVVYYEALVRMLLDGQVISPGEFIPALEREGDMGLLDRQVILQAIRYLGEYPELPKIAINLSAQGFCDERLIPYIQEQLSKHQVDGQRIIFELTESASLSNIKATKRMVSQVGQLGCEFSIDDFGTGFSTFNYLKQLPAHSVKIDGSFVVDLIDSPVDQALVRAIYEVAKALNKKTVAEFVENEATLLLLQTIGVNYAQGYYISKPKPVEQLFPLHPLSA